VTTAGADIASLIPHQGAMRLLDAVVEWNAERIVCVSERHRNPDNPLRTDGRLSSLAAIEFAAQAMAIHQRLTGETAAAAPSIGMLLSVRQCTLGRDRLDDCAAELTVEATLIAAGAGGSSYGFAVRCGDVTLAAGRASVALVTEGRP
jgi:predicted hotdog family 3-hydroxylacyl-ACP dehydratase